MPMPTLYWQNFGVQLERALVRVQTARRQRLGRRRVGIQKDTRACGVQKSPALVLSAKSSEIGSWGRFDFTDYGDD